MAYYKSENDIIHCIHEKAVMWCTDFPNAFYGNEHCTLDSESFSKQYELPIMKLYFLDGKPEGSWVVE